MNECSKLYERFQGRYKMTESLFDYNFEFLSFGISSYFDIRYPNFNANKYLRLFKVVKKLSI